MALERIRAGMSINLMAGLTGEGDHVHSRQAFHECSVVSTIDEPKISRAPHQINRRLPTVEVSEEERKSARPEFVGPVSEFCEFFPAPIRRSQDH